MTIHVEKPKGVPQSVTTGPITGSRKVYASPAGHPAIRVPLREITLSDPLEAAGPGLRPVRPLYRDRQRHRPPEGTARHPRPLDRRPRLPGHRAPRR